MRSSSRWRQAVRTIAGDALEVIFPTVCDGCETRLPPRSSSPVCAACQEQFYVPLARLCRSCSGPVGPNLPNDDCPECRGTRLPFARALACGPYEDELRKRVLLAKNSASLKTAVFLGRLLAARLREADVTSQVYDIVVKPPVHWRKHLWAPYHAADPIAETVARQFGWAFEPGLLRKTRAVKRQTLLSATARRQNLRKAVTCPTDLTGVRVLFVDDVMTTGTTARVCTRALIDAGAKLVDVAVVARAKPTSSRPGG